MVVTLEDVKERIEKKGYEKAINKVIDQIDSAYPKMPFGKKLYTFYGLSDKEDIYNDINDEDDCFDDLFESVYNKYNIFANIYNEFRLPRLEIGNDISIKFSDDDPNMEPIYEWIPEDIHTMVKAYTDSKTKHITIIHNSDIFEIKDKDTFKKIILYFLYHELTHVIRLEAGCNDPHFEGESSKEYLLSEGELNAFMVQLESGFFGDTIFSAVYDQVFKNKYTQKEISMIQNMINEVKKTKSRQQHPAQGQQPLEQE